jgi:hypothetical protein
MSQLKYTFPNWPPARMIEEACANWNMRHLNHRVSAHKAEWSRIYKAIRPWLRHQFTNYDSLLVTNPELRQELRQELAALIAKTYPWLRLGTDPRKAFQP